MKPLAVDGAILLVLAALIGGAFWYRGHVYDAGVVAGKGAQVALDTKALDTANAAAWARERMLQAQADEANTKRMADNADYEKQLAAARAAVRSGTERLSIPGACHSTGTTPQAGAAAGPGPAERTDLLPATADTIIGIAGGAAQDVRDYNALLDRYNAPCR